MNKKEKELVEAFNKSKYTKRTIHGLSKQTNLDTEEIIGTLILSPYFRPVEGCKGDMWILNK